MNKHRVLFLAANPAGSSQLNLHKEIRQITDKVRAARYRDSLEFISHWAVRPDDLMLALLEVQPHVVHFSGHGSPTTGLMLEDAHGAPQPVSQEALVHLFETLKDNIRVVVLNTCNSLPHAEALTKIIDCTIGMNRPIGDPAAITFAASFYRALGFGRTLKVAFELGLSALHLEGIPEGKTPELLTRRGIDASNFILIPQPAERTREQPGDPVQPYPENRIPTNPLVQQFWCFFDYQLQDAIALAATDAVRSGKDYISTTAFVSALRRLDAGALPDFFRHLPDGALPEPTPDDIPADRSSIESLGSLSPCIDSAISSLKRKASPKRKITSEDIYIDIARHGTGKSTLRLRSHGVTKTMVEEIVGQLGWHLIERDVNR